VGGTWRPSKKLRGSNTGVLLGDEGQVRKKGRGGVGRQGVIYVERRASREGGWGGDRVLVESLSWYKAEKK